MIAHMKNITRQLPLIVLVVTRGICAELPEQIKEVRRIKGEHSLEGTWRTTQEVFELRYNEIQGVVFTADGINIDVSNGPLVATEAIISKEKNALLIVLRAKNERNELQFRTFIYISNIDAEGRAVVVVNYLDIIDYAWEPEFEKIVEFRESPRTVRLLKRGEQENCEPIFQDVQLEEIQTRRRPDGERMENKWEELMKNQGAGGQ
jgi:hypothetical protein